MQHRVAHLNGLVIVVDNGNDVVPATKQIA